MKSIEEYKTYDEIIEDWNSYKKTKRGRLYVAFNYPLHILRGLFLYGATKSSNKWILKATELKNKELEESKSKLIKVTKEKKKIELKADKFEKDLLVKLNKLEKQIVEDDKESSIATCKEIISEVEKKIS